jgi:ubiquinol-cytochrome c reductase iron-sulfur subunit
VTAQAQNEPTRRDFLYIATGAVGVAGAAAVAWPLVDQMNPSAAVQALATIEFDLSGVAEGALVLIKWNGLPIFVRHRTPSAISEAQNTPLADLKDPALDSERVKLGQERWLVMIANCTHLGCVPEFDTGAFRGGWDCRCHGSQYDSAGRIRSGPAPKNLVLPPYEFLSDTLIKIG